MKAVVFLVWCAFVLGLASLGWGFFWLIEKFNEIPKDDDGN